MSPGQIDYVMQLVRAAVEAHRPLFNSEMRPTTGEEADARRSLLSVRRVLTRLAREANDPD